MSNRPHTAYWPGSQVCMVEACMSGRQHTLMLERCTVMVAQVGVVAPEAAQHNLSQGAVRTAPSCCKATRYGTSTVRCRRRCRRVCSSCIVRTPPAGRAAAAAGAAAAGGGRALGKVVQGFDCCRWQCSPGGPGRRRGPPRRGGCCCCRCYAAAACIALCCSHAWRRRLHGCTACTAAASHAWRRARREASRLLAAEEMQQSKQPGYTAAGEQISIDRPDWRSIQQQIEQITTLP
jgi:hypothetical protein